MHAASQKSQTTTAPPTLIGLARIRRTALSLLLLIACGLAIRSLAADLTRDLHHWLAWQETSGLVTDLLASPTGREFAAVSYRYEIEGAILRVTVTVEAERSDFDALTTRDPGQSIRVLYDPANPRNSRFREGLPIPRQLSIGMLLMPFLLLGLVALHSGLLGRETLLAPQTHRGPNPWIVRMFLAGFSAAVIQAVGAVLLSYDVSVYLGISLTAVLLGILLRTLGRLRRMHRRSDGV